MSFSGSFTFPFADSSLTSPPSPLSPEPADVHGVPPPSTATLFAEQLVPGKLSVAHLNARSMRPTDKFVELSNILTGTGCDIFCVTESWLDSTITDSEISILGYRVIRNDRVVGSSDHDLTYLVFNLYSSKPRPKLITCRNFKNLNRDLFYSDAAAADWNSVYSLPDIDSKVRAFNSLVISLFDKHAPFQTFLAKRKPNPWMFLEIKNMLNRRDRARRKFVQTRSTTKFERFRTTRNRAKQLIRNAKLRYAHTLYSLPN
ncbi:hypothetical protein M8J76_011065 [Diaphorina citri]|nr:hypothetical protein M8J76_011065 [Diaphorina citri]